MTKKVEEMIKERIDNLTTFLVIHMESYKKGLIMNKETHQLYYVFFWTGSWHEKQIVPLFKTYEEMFYGQTPPKNLQEFTSRTF